MEPKKLLMSLCVIQKEKQKSKTAMIARTKGQGRVGEVGKAKEKPLIGFEPIELWQL